MSKTTYAILGIILQTGFVVSGYAEENIVDHASTEASTQEAIPEALENSEALQGFRWPDIRVPKSSAILQKNNGAIVEYSANIDETLNLLYCHSFGYIKSSNELKAAIYAPLNRIATLSLSGIGDYYLRNKVWTKNTELLSGILNDGRPFSHRAYTEVSRIFLDNSKNSKGFVFEAKQTQYEDIVSNTETYVDSLLELSELLRLEFRGKEAGANRVGINAENCKELANRNTKETMSSPSGPSKNPVRNLVTNSKEPQAPTTSTSTPKADLSLPKAPKETQSIVLPDGEADKGVSYHAVDGKLYRKINRYDPAGERDRQHKQVINNVAEKMVKALNSPNPRKVLWEEGLKVSRLMGQNHLSLEKDFVPALQDALKKSCDAETQEETKRQACIESRAEPLYGDHSLAEYFWGVKNGKRVGLLGEAFPNSFSAAIVESNTAKLHSAAQEQANDSRSEGNQIIDRYLENLDKTAIAREQPKESPSPAAVKAPAPAPISSKTPSTESPKIHIKAKELPPQPKKVEPAPAPSEPHAQPKEMEKPAEPKAIARTSPPAPVETRAPVAKPDPTPLTETPKAHEPFEITDLGYKTSENGVTTTHLFEKDSDGKYPEREKMHQLVVANFANEILSALGGHTSIEKAISKSGFNLSALIRKNEIYIWESDIPEKIKKGSSPATSIENIVKAGLSGSSHQSVIDYCHKQAQGIKDLCVEDLTQKITSLAAYLWATPLEHFKKTSPKEITSEGLRNHINKNLSAFQPELQKRARSIENSLQDLNKISKYLAPGVPNMEFPKYALDSQQYHGREIDGKEDIETRNDLHERATLLSLDGIFEALDYPERLQEAVWIHGTQLALLMRSNHIQLEDPSFLSSDNLQTWVLRRSHNYCAKKIEIPSAQNMSECRKLVYGKVYSLVKGFWSDLKDHKNPATPAGIMTYIENHKGQSDEWIDGVNGNIQQLLVGLQQVDENYLEGSEKHESHSININPALELRETIEASESTRNKIVSELQQNITKLGSEHYGSIINPSDATARNLVHEQVIDDFINSMIASMDASVVAHQGKKLAMTLRANMHDPEAAARVLRVRLADNCAKSFPSNKDKRYNCTSKLEEPMLRLLYHYWKDLKTWLNPKTSEIMAHFVDLEHSKADSQTVTLLGRLQRTVEELESEDSLPARTLSTQDGLELHKYTRTALNYNYHKYGSPYGLGKRGRTFIAEVMKGNLPGSGARCLRGCKKPIGDAGLATGIEGGSEGLGAKYRSRSSKESARVRYFASENSTMLETEGRNLDPIVDDAKFDYAIGDYNYAWKFPYDVIRQEGKTLINITPNGPIDPTKLPPGAIILYRVNSQNPAENYGRPGHIEIVGTDGKFYWTTRAQDKPNPGKRYPVEVWYPLN